MRHGANLITEHLQAFCGGALGGFALCFKPLFLESLPTLGDGVVGFLIFVGIWLLKLFAASVMSAATGIASAYGTDIYKSFKEKRRIKKAEKFSNGQDKKDKAA